MTDPPPPNPPTPPTPDSEQQSAHQASPARPRRWYRRKRWSVSLTALLLVVVAVGGAAYWYTRPERLGRLTADLLAGMTRAQTAVDSATIQRDGTLEVTGLVMRVPGVAGPAGELFSCDRVVIRQPLSAWVTGAFEPDTIELHGPRLHITELSEPGVYNHTLLLSAQGKPRETGESSMPGNLPTIALHDGRVAFGQMPEAGKFAVTGMLSVSGTLSPAGGGQTPGLFAYEIDLADTMPAHVQSAASVQATGTVSLKDQQVIASLSPLDFDPVLGDFLPRDIRDWYHRLEPTGTVPSLTLAYSPHTRPALTVGLGLEGVALTLPNVGLRMENVRGRFTLKDEQVAVEKLRGNIENLHYQIDGHLDGLSADAPFELTLQTDPFDVEQDADFIPLMPEAVKKVFKRFAPRGQFQCAVVARRDAADEDLEVSGQLSFLNAGLTYHKFAYPLTRTTGAIRFNREQITIDNLRGTGPTGATVTVNGTVTPPGDGAEVRLRIVADDIAIDDQLVAAMEPKHRQALAFCADPVAYQALLDAGLIRADETTPGDAPVFRLAGTTRMEVDVHRPLGIDSSYNLTTAIDMAGLGVLMRPWPYPMTATGGTLRLTPGRVFVEQVTCQGPTGATGTIHGTVDYARTGPVNIKPNLKITNARVPLDGLLVASLGDKTAPMLDRLGLTGTAAAQAVIEYTQEKESDPPTVTFTVDATIDGATATPYQSSAKITDITGGVRIMPNRVLLRDLAGRIGEAPVSITGRGDFSKIEPELEVFAQGTELTLEKELLGLIDPDTPQRAAAEEFLKKSQAAGTFDAAVILRSGQAVARGEARPMVLTVRPHELSFVMNEKPVSISRMDGRVVLDGEQVQLEEVTGEAPEGRFKVSGTVDIEGQVTSELQIEADVKSIGQDTRAVLPDAAIEVIDSLEIEGGFQLRDGALELQHASDDHPEAANAFTGTITTKAMSANLGVAIEDYQGSITVDARQKLDAAIPDIKIALAGKAARVEGRWVGPLKMQLTNARENKTLLLDRFEGDCYGGTLHGSGRVDLADDRSYQFKLFMQNVALQPFLTPEKFASPLDETSDMPEPDAITGVAANPEGGVMHAGLTIFGIPGRPDRQRGRGELTIYDARLYEVPLALAVVQIANLANPSSTAFDRSGASFVLDGDTVALSRIFFETPTQVQIAGDGKMTLSDRKLDLTMFSRKPTAKRLGPISDLVDLFKDELIRVRVTGTLQDPKSKVETFGGVSDSVKDIFLGRNRPTEPRQKP